MKAMKERKAYVKECERMLGKYLAVNAKGFAEGLGNAYSTRRHLYEALDVRNDDGRVVLKKTKGEIPSEERGGMIVLPTEVSAEESNKARFLSWLKGKHAAFLEGDGHDGEMDKATWNADGPTGWTYGKFLRGRYVGNDGGVYDENSLAFEMTGINIAGLLAIAEDLCREFNQETVLVKTYDPKRLIFVCFDKPSSGERVQHRTIHLIEGIDFLVERGS